MSLKLVKPDKSHYKQLEEMLDEWKEDINLNHTNSSPNAIFKTDYHDFDNYLKSIEISKPIDGLVPDSTFFLFDDIQDEFIGATNIRHYLNDYLLKYGGHIGDGIRPSKRNKGYGTQLVYLSLLECKKLHIEKVLMTCSKSNLASSKTIIKNKGILENEVIDLDNNIIQRYWIDISNL